METLIVYANINDIEKIQKIPGFKPLYEYFEDEKVEREEWGKIFLGDIEIKFYVYSEIKYRYIDFYKDG